jgi:hypothetical protein
MITPLTDGGVPTHPIAEPPPGIWPSPGHPAHPIAPGGGQPPGIWGGGNMPYPDQGLPGRPPGIWGGAPSYPDQGLPWYPGYPSHPIAPGGGPSQGGPFPTNPIVLPPYQEGGPPVTIWPNPGHPTHPIVVPPLPPPPPDGEAIKPPPETGGWAYAPSVGWGYFPGPDAASPK